MSVFFSPPKFSTLFLLFSDKQFMSFLGNSFLGFSSVNWTVEIFGKFAKKIISQNR